MKRLLLLAIVMGGFYLTMVGFSSAEQKPKAPVVQTQAKVTEPQDSDYRDYDRDDLKTGLTRAFYDALGSAENDINEAENNGEFGEQKYIGPDGKEHTAFQEARRTIYQADRILARIKAENKIAIQKLRNPPRRILPGQAPAPKVKELSLKQKIEAQEKQVQQQQQKLQALKQQLDNSSESK
ncbi:hypothetical protein [Gimesia sp.]|uniref:hypothetical protein n=1 Tax=Gimesia sp. TaxID=2024833 RepID=UPI003A9206BA